MKFSENLRRYREQAGFKSAKEFADLLGIQYSTYVNYENSDREPKYAILSKIANTLNVSIDELIGIEKDEDKLKRYYKKLKSLGFFVLSTKDVEDKYRIVIENKDEFTFTLSIDEFMNLMGDIESSEKLTNAEYDVYNNAFEENQNKIGAELIKKIATDNSEEAKALRQTAQKLFPELFKKIMKSQESNKE